MPISLLSIWLWVSYENVFGFNLALWRYGAIEGFIVLTATAIPVLIIANFVMRSIEGRKRPKIIDHFRQSSICYTVPFVLVILILSPVLNRCFPGCAGMVFIYAFITVSFYAILINAIFLFLLSLRKYSS